MCGLVGWLRVGTPSNDTSRPTLERMANCLRHRGPDDSGCWTDDASGIALAHRRLSILDLSPAGHQPMASASDRYVIAFNGEIYNHLDLRRDLGTVSWRGRSDTETLLAAIDAWGLQKACQRSVGMFALALWDRQERSLKLARDRIGEKPLYYGWQGSTFIFASELKALRAYPGFSPDIDPDAMALYFQRGYVPAPHSIYRHIRKLLPGTTLDIVSQQGAGQTAAPVPYWSAQDVLSEGRQHPFTGSLNDAASELKKHLLEAIRSQMLADVPVGAFLSGGYDSSLVVALMQSMSNQPVKTFTIGYDDSTMNEANHAKVVAKHLGTDHTELIVSPQDAMDVIPQLAGIYDEPFGDSSAVPTMLVSRLAKSRVTVSLSGDGGDELFCGYPHYLRLSRAWRRLQAIPRPMRHAARVCVGSFAKNSIDHVGKFISPLRPEFFRMGLSERFRRTSYFLNAESPTDLHRLFMSTWIDPSILLRGVAPRWHRSENNMIFSTERQMMTADLTSYLPDDLLVKVDRAAMANSLETRIPMLDHRVFEFSASLPIDILYQDGQSKAPIRRLLSDYVPAHLTERPKQGFGIPLKTFLLSSKIQSWADGLLDPKLLAQQALLNPEIVTRRWRQFKHDGLDWSASLWLVLMFQSWRCTTV